MTTALLLTLALFASPVTTPLAEAAQTNEQMKTQIESLLRQIAELQTRIANQGGVSTGSCALTFARNLSIGSTGADVLALQQFLNRDNDTQVALYNAGARGLETYYFGARTQDAVKKFQNKYHASGVMVNGIFDERTRTQLRTLCTDTSNQVNLPTPSNAVTVSRGSEHDSTIDLGENGILYAIDIKTNTVATTLNRLDFHFSQNPFNYFDSLSLYRDNDKVATISKNSNKVNSSGSMTRVRFDGIDTSIARATTDTFTVQGTVKNSLNRNERSDTVSVFVPASGVEVKTPNSGATTLPSNALSTRSFDFRNASNGNSSSDNGEIRLTEASNSPNDKDITIDDNYSTDDVVVLVSDIEARQSDIDVTDLYVRIESSHDDPREVVHSVSLRHNNNVLDTKSVVENGSSDITATDRDGDRVVLIEAGEYYVHFSGFGTLKVNEGANEEISVRADFNEQSDSTYNDNTEVTFILDAVEGEDQSNDAVVSNNLDIGNDTTFTLTR